MSRASLYLGCLCVTFTLATVFSNTLAANDHVMEQEAKFKTIRDGTFRIWTNANGTQALLSLQRHSDGIALFLAPNGHTHGCPLSELSSVDQAWVRSRFDSTDDLRTWTDAKGKKATLALRWQHEGIVGLRGPDGTVYEFPLQDLSEADQEFVRNSIPQSTATTGGAQSDDMRTWTDADGKQATLSLLWHHRDSGVFFGPNGAIYTFPLRQLSAADRDLVLKTPKNAELAPQALAVRSPPSTIVAEVAQHESAAIADRPEATAVVVADKASPAVAEADLRPFVFAASAQAHKLMTAALRQADDLVPFENVRLTVAKVIAARDTASDRIELILRNDLAMAKVVVTSDMPQTLEGLALRAQKPFADVQNLVLNTLRNTDFTPRVIAVRVPPSTIAAEVVPPAPQTITDVADADDAQNELAVVADRPAEIVIATAVEPSLAVKEDENRPFVFAASTRMHKVMTVAFQQAADLVSLEKVRLAVVKVVSTPDIFKALEALTPWAKKPLAEFQKAMSDAVSAETETKYVLKLPLLPDQTISTEFQDKFSSLLKGQEGLGLKSDQLGLLQFEIQPIGPPPPPHEEKNPPPHEEKKMPCQAAHCYTCCQTWFRRFFCFPSRCHNTVSVACDSQCGERRIFCGGLLRRIFGCR